MNLKRFSERSETFVSIIVGDIELIIIGVSKIVMYNSYNEFIESYKNNPIETIETISVQRKSYNQNHNRVIQKVIEKKIKEGGTLEEFYELICINQTEGLVRLLNTWLSLKDLIEEAKGTFPIKDGIWKVVCSTIVNLDLKNKPENNIELSEDVLEKFFKRYSPLNTGEKFEITLEYDKEIFDAQIINSDNVLLLNWNEKFKRLLNKYYSKYEINKEKYKNNIDYILDCGFYWKRNYELISVSLNIREIVIKISDYNFDDEILISKPVMDKFFNFEIENFNYDGSEIEVNLVEDFKTKFKGYIRYNNNKFFLRWDERFKAWFKKEYQKLIEDSNIVLLKLDSKSGKIGKSYDLKFDFAIEPSGIIDSNIFEENIEDNNIKESREKKLESLKSIASRETLTNESKGQGRVEQHLLRNLLYGNKKVARCECCKKEFPVSYMKTAHIKKRKFASDEEKLDVNIVFALCPTCDVAFENGDIYVEEGYFKITSKQMPQDLYDYLSTYNDTICSCFNKDNEKYFQWHKEYHLSI